VDATLFFKLQLLWQAFSESESAFSDSGKNYFGELKLVKLQRRSSAATLKFWSAPPSAITSPKFKHKRPRDQQQFFQDKTPASTLKFANSQQIHSKFFFSSILSNTAIMGYGESDWRCINTIRVLAVS
jgi:hypothetical protein